MLRLPGYLANHDGGTRRTSDVDSSGGGRGGCCDGTELLQGERGRENGSSSPSKSELA